MLEWRADRCDNRNFNQEEFLMHCTGSIALVLISSLLVIVVEEVKGAEGR